MKKRNQKGAILVTSVNNTISVDLRDRAKQFSAFKIKIHYKDWLNLTSYRHILPAVKELVSINFEHMPGPYSPFNYARGSKEICIINNEVTKLLSKEEFIPTTIEHND